MNTLQHHTFPPSSAEAAATELVKLYVQKGHNPIACSRFLKIKSADYGDLCVCQPLGQGFAITSTFTTVSQAGGSGFQ